MESTALANLLASPWGALLIFCLRIIDVSMSMIRMILAIRGYRAKAAAIGFFEVLVWLLAVGQALQHLYSVWHVVGYAAGFATGNYVGVWLEERFAVGLRVVRAIFRNGSEQRGARAAQLLREHGYGVTEVQGRGREDAVEILDLIVARRHVAEVTQLLRQVDPEVFISIEEVRAVQGGYVRPGGRKFPFPTRLRTLTNRSRVLREWLLRRL